jgi:hypothetical protein
MAVNSEGTMSFSEYDTRAREMRFLLVLYGGLSLRAHCRRQAQRREYSGHNKYSTVLILTRTLAVHPGAETRLDLQLHFSIPKYRNVALDASIATKAYAKARQCDRSTRPVMWMLSEIQDGSDGSSDSMYSVS